jgi:hypothetical protein
LLLTYSGTRTHDNFFTPKAIARSRSNPDWMSLVEAHERNLFHRTRAHGPEKGPIVHNSAATYINPVVRESKTGRNKVRRQLWFLEVGEASIARP